MERTSQNLEFSQKLCTKSELSLLDRARGVMHKSAVMRPVCASGGDIASPAGATIMVGDGAVAVDATSVTAADVNFGKRSVNTMCADEDDDEYDDDTADAPDMDVDDCSADNDDMQQEGEKLQISPRMSVKKNRCCSGGGGSGTCLDMGTSQTKYVELNAKLNAELIKYKRELKAYNNTTKDLEEKYQKINCELNEMQQKHERFMASRKGRHSNDTDAYSDSSLRSSSSASITGSEYALKRKYTQVFHRKSSFVNVMRGTAEHSNEQIEYEYGMAAATVATAGKVIGGCSSNERQNNKSHKSVNRQTGKIGSSGQLLQRSSKRAVIATGNKENDSAAANGLELYNVLKKTLNSSQRSNRNMHDQINNNNNNYNHNSNNNNNINLKELNATIACLQNEQQQFRNIIQQQQSCLHDYHTRCIKAQRIMHAQQIEIDKLNSNNQQLETEISAGIDQLRVKIDLKLRDVSHLPQMMREEQTKYEKVSKENSLLGERLRNLQTEAAQLRQKIDELGRRKVVTINRLKAAERDLKIFKNYNTALKHEKRKLNEELQKMKVQFENIQNSSKRTMSRQREQNDKQRRDLQKRVFELELKLSRSQNSTTGLIQERDSLIAELQTQLNTLVHNFEVSQKHIRVLRRHIYTLSGGGAGGVGAAIGGTNALLQSGHNRGLTDPL